MSGKIGGTVAGDAATVITISAAATYAVAYYLQLSFYREFGLTPDQVGVDKISALFRLIPAMAAVAAALGTFAASFQVALVGFRKLRRCSTSVRAIPWIVWALASLLLAAWAGDKVDAAAPLPVLMKLLFCIVVAIPIAMAAFLVLQEVNPTFSVPRPSARIGVGMVMAWLALGAIVASGWVAVGARDLATTGHFSHRFEILGIPLDYANVSWVDQNKKASVDRDGRLSRSVPSPV